MKTVVKQSLIGQELINHVTFVLDRSGSMEDMESQVIAAMDKQVAVLARLSKEMGQETRITVLMFDYEVDVLVYDKDVLRLPSIAEHYKTRRRRTALLDATMQAIDDLSKIPHLYGDHANLVYALTDGKENESSHTPSELRRRIESLGEEWTMTTLVPDLHGEELAKDYGFPPGNIKQWNTKAADGFEKAAEDMGAATEKWMRNRASGIRGSRNAFSTDASAVNTQTIQQAGLKPLPDSAFERIFAYQDFRMDELVKEQGKKFKYKRGTGFYQLHKRELIQSDKALAVWDREKEVMYFGPGVRALVGLDNNRDERVTPQENDRYTIFVQSKADNRKIPEKKWAVVIPSAA